MKQVAKDTSDTLSAMVFYPEDKLDHSFQIYVNRPGLSFGYFFRGGGDIVEVENYIAEFTVEGYNDRAFVSTNTQKVARMEIDNGNAIEKINIDSSKPFAFVLPKNIGNITFFDINNNVVDTMSHPLWALSLEAYVSSFIKCVLNHKLHRSYVVLYKVSKMHQCSYYYTRYKKEVLKIIIAMWLLLVIDVVIVDIFSYQEILGNYQKNGELYLGMFRIKEV